MNYKETRPKLIVADPPEMDLPVEWEPAIDLSGANLSDANLDGANLNEANLREANLDGANLGGADLSRADLSYANLSYANLNGANLTRADLSEARLGGANLSGAYLSGANLSGAYLGGVNLSYADLRGANLLGATINWNSNDLVAEILWRAAGDDLEKRKIAGLVLISRGWCWKEFLALDDPLQDWALETLAQYVRDGDNAPEILKARAGV